MGGAYQTFSTQRMTRLFTVRVIVFTPTCSQSLSLFWNPEDEPCLPQRSQRVSTPSQHAMWAGERAAVQESRSCIKAMQEAKLHELCLEAALQELTCLETGINGLTYIGLS